MTDWQRLEVRDAAVSFNAVREGRHIGGLVLRPLAVNFQDVTFRATLVETEAILTCHDKTIQSQDYLLIGSFFDLFENLVQYQQRLPGRVQVPAIETAFEFETFWCDKGQDMVLRFHSPSRDAYNREYETDISWFKEDIIERKTYEFYLSPERLSEPILQLRGFIDQLQAWWESYQSSKGGNTG